MTNHFEGLVLFTIAVVVVTFTKITSPAHRRLRLDLPRRARRLYPRPITSGCAPAAR